MSVYHSSRQIVEYPEIRKGKYNKDFYFGFYCTRYEEQAKRWAARYGINGYLNKYEYVPDKSLNCKVFDGITEEWLEFIVACRNGKSHKYDIVEGPMSDDTIYNYVQNYLDRKIYCDKEKPLPQFQAGDQVRYLTHGNVLLSYDIIGHSDQFIIERTAEGQGKILVKQKEE